MRCNTRTVPLNSVVKAAMVSSYMDISKAGSYHILSHFAARALKKLSNESFKMGKQKAFLYVNRNTLTATLPPDFGGEVFVGYLDNNGQKVSINLNNTIVDENNVQDFSTCVDTCKKCGQDSSICNDLTITEDTELVIIDDTTYTQTIIKKLYPNGDYYLETRIPVRNSTTGVVEYSVHKEFITKLDLKSCGCIEESDSNISKLKTVCPDIYCKHFAPCCNASKNIGYQIFENTGLIKFTPNFPYNKIYIEYMGYIPKKNGVFHVPEVAFETLVQLTMFMSIDGKPNVSARDKIYRLEQYKRERDNLSIILGRVSLSMILHTIMQLPKFDWEEPPFTCIPVTPPPSLPSSTETSEEYDHGENAGGGGVSQTLVPLSISVVAGMGSGTPTPGLHTYQNDKLINAINIESIIVNNTPETEEAQQYSLNTTTGVITRTNPWQEGDVLIVTTFFKYI